ncbi:unnamed protein product, partial [Sphacelaria rigidula]
GEDATAKVRARPEMCHLAQGMGRLARQATILEPRPTPPPLRSRQGDNVSSGRENRGLQSMGIMAPTTASQARVAELRAANAEKVWGERDPGRARGERGRQQAGR